MKSRSKRLALAMGMLAAGFAQAGDMGGVVAYSMGEFDRVGVNQPAPKVQADGRIVDQKKTSQNAAQTAQERQLAARKAEFVRRMFWLVLSAR